MFFVFWFFGQLDLVPYNELCVLGLMSQHTVVMDTCHPLWPVQMTLSMKWYVKDNLCQKFQLNQCLYRLFYN